MTVLAAVTAHALGHIHTDPTEYLTLIKSMKTRFLFHNQGPSLSTFTLSGVCVAVVGGALEDTYSVQSFACPSSFNFC